MLFTLLKTVHTPIRLQLLIEFSGLFLSKLVFICSNRSYWGTCRPSGQTDSPSAWLRESESGCSQTLCGLGVWSAADGQGGGRCVHVWVCAHMFTLSKPGPGVLQPRLHKKSCGFKTLQSWAWNINTQCHHCDRYSQLLCVNGRGPKNTARGPDPAILHVLDKFFFQIFSQICRLANISATC